MAAIVAAIITIIVIVAVVNDHTWLARRSVSKNSVPADGRAGQAQERLKVITLTLRPHGFEPAQVTHASGRALLAVHNRSGQNEMALRLDKIAGNRLIEKSVSREKLDLRVVVDLVPGRYALTEANHPHWVCYLDITP